jgi:hypothetical protein
MIARMTTMAALTALFIAAPVTAQGPWTLDLRAGAALPTQDLGQDEISTGTGFEGSLGYRIMEHVSAYAGWDWHRFAADQSFAGSDVDFEETGYAYGVRFEHPFSGESGGGPAYTLRAGGTYNHLEIENSEGDIIADSGHGAGWEVGAGVTFGLNEAWRVSPGARYRSLSSDVELGDTTTDVDLRYVALEIGITWSF